LLAFFIPISFIDFFVNAKLLQRRRMHLDWRFGPRLLSGLSGRGDDYETHGIRAAPVAAVNTDERNQL
jgi:hypothetical protein